MKKRMPVFWTALKTKERFCTEGEREQLSIEDNVPLGHR